VIENKSIQIKLATILRKIGNKKCIEKAEILENLSSPINTLNLRRLELNSSDVTAITNCLKQEGGESPHPVNSLSLSYNPQLGDSGAIALAKNLPESICEIGLVGCGIGDVGGIELLSCIKRLPNLKMICIEHNNFSEKLRMDFEEFRINNRGIVVVL
jgi:hypothetical protein